MTWPLRTVNGTEADTADCVSTLALTRYFTHFSGDSSGSVLGPPPYTELLQQVTQTHPNRITALPGPKYVMLSAMETHLFSNAGFIILYCDQHQLRFFDSIRKGISSYIERHQLPWHLLVMTGTELRIALRSKTFHSINLLGLIGNIPEEARAHPDLAGSPVVAWSLSETKIHDHTRVLLCPTSIGHTAARYFHDLGMKRVVGYNSHTDTKIRTERISAFAKAADTFGMSCASLPLTGLDMYPDEAEAHLAKWLADQPGPLGVFLHQDNEARWFSLLCQRHQLSVPDHICILGCDNDEEVCENCHPSLSSIVVPWGQIGSTLALQLHRQLSNSTSDKIVTVSAIVIKERGSSSAPYQKDSFYRQVKRQLTKNLRNPPSIKHAAATLGMAERTLHHRLQNLCGHGPKELQMRARMDHAQTLLQAGESPICDIAQACGFANPRRFSTLFKQRLGVSPRQFRNMHD